MCYIFAILGSITLEGNEEDLDLTTQSVRYGETRFFNIANSSLFVSSTSASFPDENVVNVCHIVNTVVFTSVSCLGYADKASAKGNLSSNNKGIIIHKSS